MKDFSILRFILVYWLALVSAQGLVGSKALKGGRSAVVIPDVITYFPFTLNTKYCFQILGLLPNILLLNCYSTICIIPTGLSSPVSTE